MEDFDGESERILKVSDGTKQPPFVASLAGDTKEGFDDAAALPVNHGDAPRRVP